MLDGVGAIAVVLIASFAIDRMVTGWLFVLSFLRPWTFFFPDPSLVREGRPRAQAERRQKLVYFVFAAALGGVVLAYFGDVRVFHALGFETNVVLDAVVTGLILTTGADRVGMFLQLAEGGSATRETAQPLEITGKLVLEDKAVKAGAEDVGSVASLQGRSV